MWVDCGGLCGDDRNWVDPQMRYTVAASGEKGSRLKKLRRFDKSLSFRGLHKPSGVYSFDVLCLSVCLLDSVCLVHSSVL